MALNCTFPGELPPPAPGVPAWVDPLAIMLATGFRVTRVSVSFSTVTSFLKNDPKRVAFGISIGSGGAGNVFISPTTNPSAEGWAVTNNVTTAWFSLFTYGAMVTMPWFAFASTPFTMAVYETYALR